MNDYAIIFDMDGVICHTNPYHSIAFRQFFAKRGIHPSEEAFANHMYGKSNSYILGHFLGRTVTGKEFIDMENEKEGLFRSIYKDHVQPIDGFTAFLDQLKSRHIPTGVATSAPRANMDLIINTLGITSMMESMLGSEDVTHHKPHPEIYLTSAGNLYRQPDRCIVFEDSYSGISAARAAGAKVVGVLSSHKKEELPPCDLYIKDFNGLDADKILELLNVD